MSSVAQVSRAMQRILTIVADEAAHATGFVQRESKLGGAEFSQTLVFGWLHDPEATLEQMTQVASILGVTITPQGLDQRFTPEGAACLRQVLEAGVREAIAADPVAVPILRRFNGVYLQDSTTITLPDALAELWEGCGGTTTAGTSAALKAQAQLNMSTGQLLHLDLQAGRAQDRTAPMQTAPLPRGALRIADLGYFSVPVLSAYDQQGVFWLSRHHPQCLVYDAAGQRLDLVAFLRASGQEVVDVPIQLSAEHRLPCRLAAARVPTAVAQERRRKAKAEAKREGRSLSLNQLALLDWTIMVTNVPPSLATTGEMLVLMRFRWQIELLFKLWKSHGGVDESRSTKPYRVLCEVYAKLLAMLVQHWILITGAWQYANHSLFKAANTVRQHTTTLAIALGRHDRLTEALDTIHRCPASGARINTRKKSPNAYQLLLRCSNYPLA